MPLKVLRFIAMMLAALTLGVSLGHLMQLPVRMAWDQYLWVGATVQGGLHGMIGSLGAAIQIGAVIGVLLLVYLLREHRRPGSSAALLADTAPHAEERSKSASRSMVRRPSRRD
jgi:hypothetical protein